MQDVNDSAALSNGSAARDRLLMLLLAAERERQRTSRTIVPRGREQSLLPLSFAQERLWFLNQVGLAQNAYNMPMALRLEGRLDVKALQRSLAELIRRHEVLRTHLQAVGGSPFQIIDAPGTFVLEIRDLSAIDLPDRNSQVRTVIGAETHRPFDLAKGQLLRSMLFKLAEREHSASTFCS
jgi:hypothetical protein